MKSENKSYNIRHKMKLQSRCLITLDISARIILEPVHVNSIMQVPRFKINKKLKFQKLAVLKKRTFALE